MPDKTQSQSMPRPGRRRIHPAVYWSLTVVALALLAVGTILQSPVWILSAPVAVAGAITAGSARKNVPMVLCILTALFFVLAMLVFAP